MEGAEPRLVVFVSSAIEAEDLSAERKACVSVMDSLPLTRSWAFEFSPASSDSAEDTYLDKVDQCDIFILILGAELTDATEREYERALSQRKPRLLFVKNVEQRSQRGADWLRKRQDVKWVRFDDAPDLGQHVRVAVCDELIKAYRRFQLRPSDLETVVDRLRSEPITFVVRTIASKELPAVTETLPELQARYPDFGKWIEKKALQIAHEEAEAYVASIGGETAGFALVSEKGKDVRKISTLFIKENFRGQGVGPRLLFGVVERAARDKVKKLYVTLSEDMRDQLEPLLTRYGFFLEGVSGHRYKEGSWEWVWSKRLFYGCLQPRQLDRFVQRYLFQERGFNVERVQRGIFLARPHYNVLGDPSDAEVPILVGTAPGEDPDARYAAAKRKAEEMGLALIFVSVEPLTEPHEDGICLDSLDLEARFFPLYVQRNVEGLIIPIREAFAQMLIPRSEEPQFLAPTRVQLRTDNVYYRYPSAFRGLRRGSPLFFYETNRGQGRSRLIGEARMLEYSMDKPEELLAQYGSLGVYTLKDVRDHAIKKGRNFGKALALRFDWYREVPAPLTREQVREVVTTFDPTTARRLQPIDILELRRRIGWNVGTLSLQ